VIIVCDLLILVLVLWFFDWKFEKTGADALYIASSNGHLEVVKYLMLKGANVNHDDKVCCCSFVWLLFVVYLSFCCFYCGYWYLLMLLILFFCSCSCVLILWLKIWKDWCWCTLHCKWERTFGSCKIFGVERSQCESWRKGLLL